MARIANTNIPSNKRVVIGLTYIFGIGKPSAEMICQKIGIQDDKRVKDLTEQELISLRNLVEKKFTVEGDLRRIIALNIKKKKEIRCYEGLRHIRGLPVRGQNTHSNARTRKGKAVPIAGKKKTAAKK